MAGAGNQEALDYFDYQIRGELLDRYVALVRESKRRVVIPVMASVNCTYSYEWVTFARELQSAGADALELNMFFLPSDLARSREEAERAYFDIIARVQDEITIPVALKISPYFSDLGPMIQRLSHTGIAGLVLFNRFWSPDIDIENLRVVAGHVMSAPEEIALPLRWIALMAGRVDCDLAASTGVHDAAGLIKMLLAGATAVQMVSALYRHGPDHIQTVLADLERWMSAHHYVSLQQFKGMMIQSAVANPAAWERVQFMRTFGQRMQGPGHEPFQSLDGFTGASGA
jgi:dihydroorotate dehydrogenase (fumarate)